MKSPAFEIRVAILGHVSVGKTTVLNALLGDKFSEVSKKRTTAGINHFKIVSTIKGLIPEEKADEVANHKKRKFQEIDQTKDKRMSAAEILTNISAENVELRKKNNIIQECTIDVEVPEELFPMHPNTNLIITDVPGVNEAGSSAMYLNYVTQIWDGLDCVVIVMDANQGVNTEDQVNLLEFVKGNMKKAKMIPTFILCNKVDDPNDEELMSLVDEVRGKVTKMFERMKFKPTLMHISAENAFAYRAASRLTRENMHQLNLECLDKIGHEEVGKVKWRRMKEEEKLYLVSEVVSNETEYKERLSLSNFDKFLGALSSTLGGSTNQVNLIEGQLKVQLKKVKVSLDDEALFADSLMRAFDCSLALGKPPGHLRKKFWTLYSSCKTKAFQKFETCPSNVKYLQKPMKELQSYARGIHLESFSSTSIFDEKERIADEAMMMDAMRDLVSSQIKMVLDKEVHLPPNFDPMTDPWAYNFVWYNDGVKHSEHKSKSKHPESGMYTSHWNWKRGQGGKWYNKYDTNGTRVGSKDMNPALYKPSWKNLQPKDWCTIFFSILLVKYNKHFCKDFSAEIVKLEMRKCFTIRFSGSSWEGRNVLKDPTSLCDPNHFGSLSYMYCEFLDTFSK